MKQWGWYFNQTRCISCKACVLACKNWNDDKRGDANIKGHESYSWVETNDYQVKVGETEKLETYINPNTDNYNHEEFRKHYMKERWRRVPTPYGLTTNYDKSDLLLGSKENGVIVGTFPDINTYPLSISCNHCEHPACIEVCPMQIIYKEPEYGVVLVENENCISCGSCHLACPWNAPQYYNEDFNKYAQEDPKRPKMTKCTFCIDRISSGRRPACVAACLNRALDAGPIDELRRKYPDATLDATNFDPNQQTISGKPLNPNIIFKKKV